MDQDQEDRMLLRESVVEGVLVSGVLVAAALLIYAFAPAGVDTLGLFVLAAAPVAGAARTFAVWRALERGAEPSPARLSGRAAVVVGVLILFVLLFTAVQVGAKMGRERAIAEREAWSRGCWVEQEKPCVDVLRGGAVVGTGFVIAESDQALAFYDPASQSVRQLLKREGALTLRPAVRIQP